MRVAIYARVSTESQEARGTIGSQLEVLRKRVAAEGHQLVAEYRDAIQLQPKDAGLRVGLADALIRAGKSDEAMTTLKEASNLDNNDPRPHRMIGVLLIQKKD